MKISNRLVKHAAAAASVVVAASANAAVVTWDCNLAIPANFDGLYINIETQATGTSASGVAGWDINPYGASTLNFFYGTGTTYVRTQGSGGPSSLAEGTVISASSTFANATTAVISSAGVGSNGWSINAINYFGFRFTNAAGATLYGFGKMQVGASATERTLLSLSYEDSGAAITVPAPGALALLGVAGLAGTRRRR
jgi:MYXO-CTERM domain-containing protein